MKLVALALSAVVSFAACDKGGSSKTSGALAGADVELFKSLPSGPIAFGGNVVKMESFMQSTLGKAIGRPAKTFADWQGCFDQLKDMKVAGVATLGGGAASARMVFSGVDTKDVSTCANKAGLKSTMDPDGKFIAIEVPIPRGTVKQGWLKLADGALYMNQELGVRALDGKTRAELEADVASVAKGTTAADDKKLQAIVGKADRGKTFWFAASGAGTPLADQVVEAYGSVDLSSGLAVDVTAQLASDDLANKVEKGFAQGKQMAGAFLGEAKSAIDAIELKRDGARVHATAKLSDAQLASLMNAAAMFGGGLGGR